MANRWLPVAPDTPFAAFSGLSAILKGGNPADVADAIAANLADHPPLDAGETLRIQTVHAALIDAEINTVGELAERSAMQIRTLERFCVATFGFSPRLLLQRQRFLRSLSHFMLDPSLSWIDTIDTRYHDQAHFIRDFKRFMNMTPSQYAQMPHPVMWAAAVARTAAAGTPMQVLQAP